jgi:hypothetical protein
VLAQPGNASANDNAVSESDIASIHEGFDALLAEHSDLVYA